MHGVRTGLDRLLADEQRLARLRDARVGLLVNPTSVTAQLVHAIDALRSAGVAIVRIFGPEHGVRGEAQDMESVDGARDPVTDLPVVSLYGDSVESLAPEREDLDGLDIVLADIQDIGARYYTYAYTVGLLMEACGEADVEVWVLDRPNPLGGEVVRGDVVAPEFRSFVGMQPLATRHGMTLGELALFFARHCDWSCDLEIVEMQGWTRDMWFDETGLPWVMPSPNMPTLETATVYPGQCLLEGTNLSEGRGTTRPFELFGAPWIEPRELREELETFDEIEGVLFREISFRPMFQKHARTTCRGLQLHVTDRDSFDSLATSYALLSVLLRLYPDAFDWRTETYEFVSDRLAIDLLLGDDTLRERLEAGDDPIALADADSERRATFDELRADCLLYESAS
jgi:uncharacterized protein YbbC (DUF1343 family)